MFTPANLATQTPEQLYALLDDLTEYRRSDGRGRTPEAAYVREYCASERVRVKRELARRGLPATRPGDTRVYGPGVAAWQKAGA